MCATQLNPLVHQGVIAQHCIVRVTDFIINSMGSGQKICILLGVEAAGSNPGDKIGAPTDISKAGNLPPVNNNINGGGAQPMYGNVQQNNGGGNPYNGSNANRVSPSGGGNPYGGGSSNNNRFGGGNAPVVRNSSQPYSASACPATPVSSPHLTSPGPHLAAIVSPTDQNWGWSNVKGSCGGHDFMLGPNAERICGGLHASTKMSTATFEVKPIHHRHQRGAVEDHCARRSRPRPYCRA